MNLRWFDDGTVGCIYAGELWEHFEYDDAARLTHECYRVLAPGGVLRVRVPERPGSEPSNLASDASGEDDFAEEAK